MNEIIYFRKSDFQQSEIDKKMAGLRRSMPCELCKKRFRTMIRILSVYYSDISAYSRANLKKHDFLAVPMFLFLWSQCRQNSTYFSGFSRKTIKTESPVCADWSVSRRRYDCGVLRPLVFAYYIKILTRNKQNPKHTSLLTADAGRYIPPWCQT